MSKINSPTTSIVKQSSKAETSLSLINPTSIHLNRHNKPVKILDEDTFIEKLEKIIEKDFFPDLERLKIKQAYYEALQANDYNKIKELHIRYNNLLAKNNNNEKSTPLTQRTPMTPKYFDGGTTPTFVQAKSKSINSNETPYSNEEPPLFPSDEDLISNQKTAMEDMSLDKFLAQNTSEDNVSFEVIMQESKREEKKKVHQSWLFEKEKLHQLNYDAALMLESGDRRINDDVTKSLDTWTYKSKNTLMYIPGMLFLKILLEIVAN
jgi:protein DGCR14